MALIALKSTSNNRQSVWCYLLVTATQWTCLQQQRQGNEADTTETETDEHKSWKLRTQRHL